MEIVKKYRQVEYEVYKTSDGKEFSNKTEAQLHEDILKGSKRVCGKCNGKGRINGRYEKELQNTSWVPTQGEYIEVWKDNECPDCKGKGFSELKWV